jgi:iron(III) transport system substrate-binding protein
LSFTLESARRIAALATIGAVTLTISACGSTQTSAAGPTGGAAQITTTPIASVLPEANTEGLVVWYNAFTEDDINAVVAEFNKTYPGIKVQSLRLDAQQVPAKVTTEQKAGAYNADVISTNAEYLNQLRLAGALSSYDPPDLQKPPAELKLPPGFQSVTYINTTVIADNPKEVQKLGLTPPTTWSDLTDPAWKGHFSIDPESLNWYQSLIAEMGHDKALALVTALGNNSPVLVPNHTLAVTQVQSGEQAATATAYSHKVVELADDLPGSITFANSSPLPADLTLTDVAKNPPHPAAAQVFDDWLASKAGQAALVDKTAKISLRTDVDNDPRLWDPTKWPAAYADPLVSPSDYNSELTEFDAALHYGG